MLSFYFYGMERKTSFLLLMGANNTVHQAIYKRLSVTVLLPAPLMLCYINIVWRIAAAAVWEMFEEDYYNTLYKINRMFWIVANQGAVQKWRLFSLTIQPRPSSPPLSLLGIVTFQLDHLLAHQPWKSAFLDGFQACLPPFCKNFLDAPFRTLYLCTLHALCHI